MRKTLVRMLVVALAATAVLATGCAKKPPAPATAPPAPAAAPAPQPTATPPPAESTAPAPAAATIADLHTVYFALDSWSLDDAAKATLDANAKVLRDNASMNTRIEGNCDERGTVEYNMSLGQKRADAVKDYLVGAGVAASRLSTISYGKERPAVEGHDEASWSKNRRCEFSKP